MNIYDGVSNFHNLNQRILLQYLTNLVEDCNQRHFINTMWKLNKPYKEYIGHLIKPKDTSPFFSIFFSIFGVCRALLFNFYTYEYQLTLLNIYCKNKNKNRGKHKNDHFVPGKNILVYLYFIMLFNVKSQSLSFIVSGVLYFICIWLYLFDLDLNQSIGL